MDINPATATPVSHRSGAGSYAAFRGHPVHPMLVPLVVGGYFAAILADIAFAATHDPFWARSASWLLAWSLFAGCVTAIPGIIDLLSVDRARRLPAARMHAAGNSAFLGLVAINFVRRLHESTVPPGGLTLSLLGLIFLVGAGWLGGAMVYRHGIGVSPGIGLAPEVGAGTTDNTLLAARADRLTRTEPAYRETADGRD